MFVRANSGGGGANGDVISAINCPRGSNCSWICDADYQSNNQLPFTKLKILNTGSANLANVSLKIDNVEQWSSSWNVEFDVSSATRITLTITANSNGSAAIRFETYS